MSHGNVIAMHPEMGKLELLAWLELPDTSLRMLCESQESKKTVMIRSLDGLQYQDDESFQNAHNIPWLDLSEVLTGPDKIREIAASKMKAK